jgi:hypothetical protein
MANDWASWANRPVIVDDRCTEHRLVTVMMLRRDPRQADARYRLVIDRVIRHFKTSRLVALVAGLSGLFFASMMPLLKNLGVPIWGAMVGFYALMIVVGRFAARGMAERARPGFISSMLTDGLCPSCAYSFEGLTEQSDGCYECPECGAAWKASRVLRRTRFDEKTGDQPWNRPVPWWKRIGQGVGMRRMKDDAKIDGPATDPRFRAAIQASSEEGRVERLRAIAAAMRWNGVVARGALAVLYLGFAIAAGAGSWWAYMFARSQIAKIAGPGVPARLPIAPLMGTVGFLFMGLIALMFWRSNIGMSKKKLKRECLVRGVCPRCAADLPSGPIDEEGRVTCVECAGVWKVNETPEAWINARPDDA